MNASNKSNQEKNKPKQSETLDSQQPKMLQQKQLDPQQLKAMYEAEKQERADKCALAVEEVLKHFNCDMFPSVELIGTRQISQIKFIPR